MRLKFIKYTENEGKEPEWQLEGFSLADTNLLVGKNASGKSRILNLINALARHVAGIDPPRLSGNYDANFINGREEVHYLLKYEEGEVTEEKFYVNGEALLDRGAGGEELILAQDIDGQKKMIRFQTPPSELAAVARRDTIQHKFLEPLYAWGSSLRHYSFGSTLGKDRLAVLGEKEGREVNDRDPNAVVRLYRQAVKEFEEPFKRAVLQDLRLVDYDAEDLGIRAPVSIRVQSDLPGELVGLFVKERELPGITDQHSMSQGMFRVLSILIHVNYSQMAKKSTCLLIDDIGEGLDFDRSCRLIDLLRDKAKASNIQLVLSTNDRFVMNRVPLEEWSVLQRRGNQVKVLNYENSRDLFEEFKFTGLSNFSFLEMGFANGAPAEEASIHE